MGLGIFFSVLASLCFSLSNVLEKIAVDRMPGMSPSRAMQMLNLLRNSKLWLGGFLFGAVAVALAVVAYALAPITVVQSIIAAGLVVIVAISRLVLREKIRPREWVGLSTILVALILVSITLRSSSSQGTRGSFISVAVADSATLVIAALGFFALRKSSADHSISFGTTAGLLYGVAALQVKAASSLVVSHGFVDGIPRIFGASYPYVFIVTSILGLAVFQTGLQRSRVAVVAPLTNTIASVYVVAIGMVIFGESLPASLALTLLRISGFALVLLGSWFFATGSTSIVVPVPTQVPAALDTRDGKSD